MPRPTGRYILNYKRIPYKTEWVEYPDIEAVVKKIGAKPTEKKPDGRDHYTVPVIHDPSTGAVVADSFAIGKYLDTTYPNTPRVFPPGLDALQAAFLAPFLPTYARPLFQILIARVPGILNPRSAEYFRATREVMFGKRLEEIHAPADWDSLKEAWGQLRGFISENGEEKDMFLGGDLITYCDVQVASMLVWVRAICRPDSEEWKRIAGLDDGFWGKYLERFDKYAQVI